MTLEVPDEVYAALERAAGEAGVTPTEWITGSVRRLLPAREDGRPLPEPGPNTRLALEQIALQEGRPFEEVMAEWRKEVERRRPKPRPELTEEERRAAREQFSRHIGAIHVSSPYGVDNEQIDADLAREYGNTHEDER